MNVGDKVRVQIDFESVVTEAAGDLVVTSPTGHLYGIKAGTILYNLGAVISTTLPVEPPKGAAWMDHNGATWIRLGQTWHGPSTEAPARWVDLHSRGGLVLTHAHT